MDIQEILKSLTANIFPVVKLNVAMKGKRPATCSSCHQQHYEEYDKVPAGTTANIIAVKITKHGHTVSLEFTNGYEEDICSGKPGAHVDGHNFSDYTIVNYHS